MKSKVYFTNEISSEKLVEIYKKLGVELNGKVAVKVHSGEKGNQNYLRPEFLRQIVGSNCIKSLLKLSLYDYNKSEIEPAFRDGFEEKRKDGFYVRHVLQDLTPTSFDFRKANANMEISLIEGRD